jgi:hypothetical protein
MKIAYFDCFSGISGDMCLGALVDAGLSLRDLSKGLQGLRLTGFSLSSRRVRRGGLSTTKVDVRIKKGFGKPMTLSEIQRRVKASRLPEAVRDRSLQVFENLAQAEGRVHRTQPAKVHFHELGVVDSFVDIVGTVLGCHLLGVEAIYASALNIGFGTVRSEHGLLPVPAPVTAHLLTGLPVYAAGPACELTTPTGAALIATLATDTGPMPAMTLRAVAYGAGTFNPPNWPNALRLMIGESLTPSESDRIMVLETNLDDMNPQAYELLLERLLAQGALDVTLTPVIMKRGRPGIILNVLADPAKVEALLRVIFAETTTLGVRVQETARRMLPREIMEVSTSYGPVRVKVAKTSGTRGVSKARPEYRDCKRIAEQTGLPLRTVMREVEKSLRRV